MIYLVLSSAEMSVLPPMVVIYDLPLANKKAIETQI